MRMWKVDPQKLCRAHLLAEHCEMHMFIGSIKKSKNLKGFIDGGIVEIHNIKNRHDELVKEMESRGYNHRTPMEQMALPTLGSIDVDKNVLTLRERCRNCKF